MTALSNLFGSTKVQAPTVNYTPSGFSAGGLDVGGSGNVTTNANRSGTVGDLSNTYGTLGNETGNLRSEVAPGYNDILKARLTDLGDQSRAAIGNLSDNLRSRRILGSSFGEDTITRTNNEFNKQRDSVIAQNKIDSLNANNTLLQQQYGAYAKQFQTGLDELNLEANLGAGVSSNINTLMAQTAAAQAKLSESANEFNATASSNQAAGFGKLLGVGGSLALAPVTGGLSLAALPAFTGAK